MKAERYVNDAIILGDVISEPVLSHQVDNLEIYRMTVGVKRKNGYEDKITVYFSDIFFIEKNLSLHMGSKVEIHGHLYVRQNEPSNLYIYAKHMKEHKEGSGKGYMNNIRLEGYVRAISDKIKVAGNGNICVSVMVSVNDNKHTMFVKCNLWELSERERKQLKLHQKLFMIGALNSFESPVIVSEEDGKEAKDVSYKLAVNTTFF